MKSVSQIVLLKKREIKKPPVEGREANLNVFTTGKPLL